MLQHGIERRQERSSTRSGATFLLLDSLIEKHALTGVVLTNERGFLLASTRGRFDAAEVAAFVANPTEGNTPAGILTADLFVYRMNVNDVDYTLVAVGGRVARVRAFATALERILAPTKSFQA